MFFIWPSRRIDVEGNSKPHSLCRYSVQKNSKPHSTATLVFFLGVGGSGRSPLNPPTPRGPRAPACGSTKKKRKFILVFREAMKLVVKCSLRRARGQGLGGSKGTPGCRLPPVSRGKMLPLTQRWHGGAPTWVHVWCSGGRFGCFGGDFGPQKGIRGSQNRISVCSDGRISKISFTLRHNSFHFTSLRFISPHQNSFQHTSLHPTSLHFQK